MDNDQDKPAETGEKTEPTADVKPPEQKPRKPSPTATPERKAAAKAANTAKPQPKKETEIVSSVDGVAELKKDGLYKGGDVDFAALTTIEEYVAMYNEMVLTATDVGVKKITTVKSFDSLKTGKLACERLHAAIQKAVNPTAVTKETTVKKAKTAKTAKKTATKKTAKKPAKKAKGTGAPRSKYEGTAKITWIGKENPYREGSGRHERVELLRKSSGKTVETYLKNGGRGSTLSHSVGAKLVKVG